MIYGFAKQSQGHAKIYSEVGHGTTVRLYLPRKTDGDGASRTRRRRIDHERAAGSETILVVEDDADVRAFVTGQLSDLGYRVIEAADGPQAQRILDSDQPIDLLFTDVVMPGGMTGRQLADAARARRPGLKAVFTSGYTENSDRPPGQARQGRQLSVEAVPPPGPGAQDPARRWTARARGRGRQSRTESCSVTQPSARHSVQRRRGASRSTGKSAPSRSARP